MYTLPQELEVWYIIPAIRRELSKCLIRDFNVSYEKVGSILGISKAAVSQYIKSKRAAKVKLPKEVSKEVSKACSSLINEKSNAVDEIQRILQFMRTKELSFEVCDDSIKGVFENCKEIKVKG